MSITKKLSNPEFLIQNLVNPMSIVHFYKYQAAGNDFLLVDNRKGQHTFSNEQISALCHRRFGIGADGIILLSEDSQAEFRMIYHNADGSQSFCGNGCRAVVDFAHRLGHIGKKTVFMAHDGRHEAEILGEGNIRVSLNDVRAIEEKSASESARTPRTSLVRKSAVSNSQPLCW